MLSLKILTAARRSAAVLPILFSQCRRPVATSAVRLVKERKSLLLFVNQNSNFFYFAVKINEDGDTITFEAVSVESERKAYLVPEGAVTTANDQTSAKHQHHQHQNCSVCPLCRLNLRRLSYSVLILDHL